jgi:hypothetical protein
MLLLLNSSSNYQVLINGNKYQYYFNIDVQLLNLLKQKNVKKMYLNQISLTTAMSECIFTFYIDNISDISYQYLGEIKSSYTKPVIQKYDLNFIDISTFRNPLIITVDSFPISFRNSSVTIDADIYIASYFNNNSLLITDDTSNNNHTLTNNGPVTIENDNVNGFNDTALFSDVIESHFEIYPYNEFASGNPIAFSFWFKSPDVLPNENTVILFLSDTTNLSNTFDYFRIGIFSSGRVFMQTRINNSSSTTSSETALLDNNQWHHCVINMDINGTNRREIYIDGILNATSNSSNIIPFTDTLTIGCELDYNTSQSRSQVQANAFASYDMTDNNDSTTNNYHLTNNNNVLTNQTIASRTAATYNGTDSYHDANVHVANFHTHTDKSVEFWLYLETDTTKQTIYALNESTTTRRFTISILASTRLIEVERKNDLEVGVDFTSTTAVPLTTWTHIVIVFGTTNKIYIDGVDDTIIGDTSGVLGNQYDQVHIGTMSTIIPATISDYDTLVGNATHRYQFINNVNDTSGNDYNGVVQTDTGNLYLPTYETHLGRQYIQFNNPGGAGDDTSYINLDSQVASFETIRAVSFWIRRVDNSTIGDIITEVIFSIKDVSEALNRDRYQISIRDEGSAITVRSLLSDINNDVISTKMNAIHDLRDTNWHHIIINCDNGNHLQYFDGSAANVTYTSGNSTSTSTIGDILDEDRVMFGANVKDYPSINANYACTNNTQFYDVMFFSSALSATDVTNLYNEVVGNPESSIMTNHLDGSISDMNIYSFALDSNQVNSLATESTTSQGFYKYNFYNGNLYQFNIFNRTLQQDEINLLSGNLISGRTLTENEKNVPPEFLLNLNSN